MLNQYHHYLKGEASSWETKPFLSYRTSTTLGVIEQALDFSAYGIHAPEGYPSGVLERHGFRTLRDYVFATFGDYKVSIGSTILHTRRIGEAKNVEAIIITCVDTALTCYTPPEEISSQEIEEVTHSSMIGLLDNGILTSTYEDLKSSAVLHHYWGPAGYPQNKEEVANLFQVLAAFFKPVPVDLTTNAYHALLELTLMGKVVIEKANSYH